MNIYFTIPAETIKNVGKDLEGIKDDIDAVRLPPESKAILNMVKDWATKRFKIFEDEIIIEESNNEECYVLMNFTNHPAVLEYVNYSEVLANKMKQSFTQDDWDYLERYGFGK